MLQPPIQRQCLQVCGVAGRVHQMWLRPHPPQLADVRCCPGGVHHHYICNARQHRKTARQQVCSDGVSDKNIQHVQWLCWVHWLLRCLLTLHAMLYMLRSKDDPHQLPPLALMDSDSPAASTHMNVTHTHTPPHKLKQTSFHAQNQTCYCCCLS